MLKMRTAFEEKVNFGFGEKQKPEGDELTIDNANQKLKAALVCKIETLMGLG